MKEHGHVTKFDAFWYNRNQVMDFVTWFKIYTNVYNFGTASAKLHLTLKIFYQFCDNHKIPSWTYYLEEAY